MQSYDRSTELISIHALREEGDLRDDDHDVLFGIFLSTPSARRATMVVLPASTPRIFLSTPSARRATPRRCVFFGTCNISIHALREEGDCVSALGSEGLFNFYPRPPRGGRLGVVLNTCREIKISIHALREEGDDFLLDLRLELLISIHALREEGDMNGKNPEPTEKIFLSTPSARRATAPCIALRNRRGISIHALREEGDLFPVFYRNNGKFLSTPSARRATIRTCTKHQYSAISIHALREEGDWVCVSFSVAGQNFYPRPPRGGRQNRPDAPDAMLEFLSTPSARRATAKTEKNISTFVSL